VADVGKPVEILDKQIDLARWLESTLGQQWAQNFVATMASQDYHPKMFSVREQYGEWMARCLNKSLPYFITDQMVDKIWAFSKGFATVGFYPEDLPCPFGFMWLAKPVYTLDIRGRMMGTRAITWAVQEGGVVLSFFTDKHDEYDEVNVELKERMGKRYPAQEPELSLNHIQPVVWGDKTPLSYIDTEELVAKYKASMRPTHLDDPPSDVDKMVASEEEHFALCRFVVACWEWMGYQLPAMHLPHRQMARRLGRSNLEYNQVLVIDLQATEPSHTPPATHQVVEWHYRFRSRAHKRRYVNKKTGEVWYGDVRGCIKGPEHLPLIEKDVLYKVRRGHAPV
jgi:hypothetical protein